MYILMTEVQLMKFTTCHCLSVSRAQTFINLGNKFECSDPGDIVLKVCKVEASGPFWTLGKRGKV